MPRGREPRNVELGKLIREQRKELGYGNQSEFADAVGVHVRTISGIELGEQMSVETARKLEHELGWPIGRIDEVLGWQPDEPTSGGENVQVEGVAAYLVAAYLDDGFYALRELRKNYATELPDATMRAIERSFARQLHAHQVTDD